MGQLHPADQEVHDHIHLRSDACVCTATVCQSVEK